MKIAVTGHTVGLGKAFFDYYSSSGHQVLGFSRQNGFDLRDWSCLQRLLDCTDGYDLLISNAKPDFFQAVLLYEMARRTKRVRQVISIGSLIINLNIPQDQPLGFNLYKTQKLALRDAHIQLTKKYNDFDSVLVHPSHLYDNDQIDYVKLAQWIGRLEDAMKTNINNEIYVN